MKTQNEEVKALHDNIRAIKVAIIKCFRERPYSCDGHLMVRSEDYNTLVEAVNKALGCGEIEC